MIVLGVPVLSRYDLLERLLVSAEAGTVKPDLYLVVDNGGRFEPEKSQAVAAAIARGARLEILSAGENLGVAASWNRILDRATPHTAIISNDDIVLGIESVEVLSDSAAQHDFVIADGGKDANGWCLFAQSSMGLVHQVGHYDENFYPAYYEDSDYRKRMLKIGVVPFHVASSHRHDVRGTLQLEPADGPVHEGQKKGLEYFDRKWGGPPDRELFPEPFDGAPVDWQKRNSSGEWKGFRSPLRRWDVIDRIGELVGRHRYLEIGVSGGDTMKKARFKHRVGVDPNPTVEAVRASTVFYPMTSDDYFSLITSPAPHFFDVVFVDGLHHADQAYRDIENACEIANARAVVVHDASPTTEAMQRVPYSGGDWTGDVWKAVAKIRAEGKHTVRTIDADFGIAVIIPDRPEPVTEFPRETWDDLVRHRVELLGLLSEHEWRSELDTLLSDTDQTA